MKKFIINILSFSVCAFLFYCMGLFVWGNYMPQEYTPNINYKIGSYGQLHTRLSEVKEIGEIDILFLGSSRTYRGFDTRVFTKNGVKKSFNLGSSAQTHIQTNLLVKRYLGDLNPKLIIYEVYPEGFTYDGVESSLDIIANDKNDFLSLKMAFELHNLKVYNTFLYASMRNLLRLDKDFKLPVKYKGDTYVPGGYSQKRLLFWKPSKLNKQNIKLRQNQRDKISETLALFKEKNIEVLLVYAPITKASYSRYSNNEYFDGEMKKYGNYYNFNEFMNLTDTLHFYDSNHLNHDGVEIFNQTLIDTLKSDGVFNRIGLKSQK